MGVARSTAVSPREMQKGAEFRIHRTFDASSTRVLNSLSNRRKNEGENQERSVLSRGARDVSVRGTKRRIANGRRRLNFVYFLDARCARRISDVHGVSHDDPAISHGPPLSEGIGTRGVPCRTVVKLHTYRYDPTQYAVWLHVCGC